MNPGLHSAACHGVEDRGHSGTGQATKPKSVSVRPFGSSGSPSPSESRLASGKEQSPTPASPQQIIAGRGGGGCQARARTRRQTDRWSSRRLMIVVFTRSSGSWKWKTREPAVAVMPWHDAQSCLRRDHFGLDRRSPPWNLARFQSSVKEFLHHWVCVLNPVIS